MVEGGVGGSDESFISFAFAIVSVVMIILYIPWIVRHAREAVEYYTTPRKKRSGLENPITSMWDSLTYIPRVLSVIMASPGMLTAGARICWSEKVFFVRCVMPKFLKFIIRPRILVLWLWAVLFSSAMYATLTFDAHGILGVERTATTNEIKKAYRAMSKRYHPDQNNTDEARDIYMQVRRAYKALVDREAFEEEESKNSHAFTVGIALPRFLTSREHDGLVLFGLLGILIALPIAVWYKFRTTQKIPHLLWHVNFDKERVERFLGHLGIPEDPKYVERRESRRRIHEVLVALGIIPPNVDESVVANFPPFPEFVARCVQVDKNMAFFEALFDSEAIQTLHEFMLANGEQMLVEFKQLRTGAAAGESERQLVSRSDYRAIRYLFWQHTVQVDRALTELLEAMGGGLPSARKLLNLHEELYDLLRLVFEAEGKPNKQHIPKITAMPQRVSDIVDSLLPEIEAVQRRMYKNYFQQQVTNKHDRRLLKASMRKM